ncbi:MAG: hypothetical protein AAFP84_21580 [Actinomycetota bacterium]
MDLEEIWTEISQAPPSDYQTRQLIDEAHAISVAVDTERSRELAPALAALYFDNARSAAELVPVLNAVNALLRAVDRSPDAESEYEPRAVLTAASDGARKLLDRLAADIDEHADLPAGAASRQLAASVAGQVLRVHRLHPTVASLRLYALASFAIYAVLVPAN